MATMVDFKYKDGEGTFQTVSADVDSILELLDVPAEKEYSIKITDDESNTETHEFIGPGIKH